VGIKSYSLDLLHYTKKTWSAITSDAEIIHLQHEYNIFGPGSICSWPVIILLLIANIFTEKKIVITFHTAWDNETLGDFVFPLDRIKSLYIWLNNRLLVRSADHIFFLSDNVEEYFTDTFDMADVSKISHGVQSSTIDPTKREARAMLGWDDDSDIVILPGYIRPQKNCETFIQVAKEDKSRQYIIAGGVRNNKFEDYAEELFSNLPENVSVTGILEDDEFEAAFIAADLCYLPYQDVSQSGNVNWSLANELPVFGSEIKYFHELSEKTESVKIVGTDPEEVVSEIQMYFSNKELRNRMAESAREFAQRNGMKEIGEEHVRVYKSLSH
jgi:glycosyltransferase involved in cell wall biosynthesis